MSSLGDKDENKRLAMRWTGEDIEGLCVGPIYADEVEHKYETLDFQMQDVESLFSYYKRGIALRKKYPAIAAGNYEVVDMMTNDNIATVIRRVEDSEEDTIIVIYNLNETEMNVEIEGLEKSYHLVDFLSIDNEEITQKGQDLIMPKRSIAILQ
jgi:glycosidase